MDAEKIKKMRRRLLTGGGISLLPVLAATVYSTVINPAGYEPEKSSIVRAAQTASQLSDDLRGMNDNKLDTLVRELKDYCSLPEVSAAIEEYSNRVRIHSAKEAKCGLVTAGGLALSLIGILVSAKLAHNLRSEENQ